MHTYGQPRILLLGATGQVGQDLLPRLSKIGQLIIPQRPEADLAHTDTLTALLKKVTPDILVNAAAYTHVDGAEERPDYAMRCNADAPRVMASYAKQHHTLLVHYSTDYVYDGSGANSWDETSAISPLNIYGQSKALGDQAILTSGCPHLILRTSWVYSDLAQSFVQKILHRARNNLPLSVVTDQIGAPTSAHTLADITATMLAAWQENPQLNGLYHVACSGVASWYDFARIILNEAGFAHVPITRLTTAELASKAKRPLNSRLSLTKLKQDFGITPPDWDQNFRDLWQNSFYRMPP